MHFYYKYAPTFKIYKNSEKISIIFIQCEIHLPRVTNYTKKKHVLNVKLSLTMSITYIPTRF